MRNSALTNARRAYAISAYKNGTPIKDIASSLEISHNSAYLYVRHLIKPRASVTPEIQAQIFNLSMRKLNRNEIASILNISPYTVSRWRTIMGIGNGKPNPELMKSLQETGMSHREIAKRTGVSEASVRKYLGKQPKAITNKSRKMAGVLRSAKTRMMKLPLSAFETKEEAVVKLPA